VRSLAIKCIVAMLNIKRNPKLLVITALGLVVVAIVLWNFMRPASSFLSRFRKMRYSEMSFAVGHCGKVIILLEQYYAQTQTARLERDVEDFVDFVMHFEDWQELSTEPPPEAYEGSKVGFFFFLPNKLDSDTPVYIGYTTPVTDESGKIYRLALLLQGSRITTILMDRQLFVEEISDTEDYKKEYPDLWAWKKRQ